MSNHDKSMGAQAQPGRDSGRTPVEQMSLFDEPPQALEIAHECPKAADGAASVGRSNRSRRSDAGSHPENWLWDNCPMLLDSAAGVDALSGLGRWDGVNLEFLPDEAALVREKFHDPSRWKVFRIAVASAGRLAVIAHTAKIFEHTGRELWKGVRDRKLALQICLGMNLVRLELVTAHGKFETLRRQLIPGIEPTRLRRYQRWFRTIMATPGVFPVKMADLRARPELLDDWSIKRIMEIAFEYRSFKELMAAINPQEANDSKTMRTPKRPGYRLLLEHALTELEKCNGNEALILQIKDRLRE